MLKYVHEYMYVIISTHCKVNCNSPNMTRSDLLRQHAGFSSGTQVMLELHFRSLPALSMSVGALFASIITCPLSGLGTPGICR